MIDPRRVDLRLEVAIRPEPQLQAGSCSVVSVPLLLQAKRQRMKLPALRVRVRSFRFPEPVICESRQARSTELPQARIGSSPGPISSLGPPSDAINLKDRLFYKLQPPIETWVAGRAIHLPARPFPYQTHGVAFLVAGWSALLGDEMGLGKTMQAILAVRMLFGSGMVRRVLLVCPKPLVSNWGREFRAWASDVPTLVIEGSTRRRHALWELPQMPVKIVNYESLVRDAEFLAVIRHEFDLVVLDEAQRIKNEHAQTSKAVRALARERSWALTGTPLENRPEDLMSIFAFLKPGLICGAPSPRRLREVTRPYVLRRLKEQVLGQLPPKFVRDAHLDLSASQRCSYDTAERDGVLRLNELGDAVTIQNVFELVLRLKQICNFDPATGDSAKMEQLRTDIEEIASSGRKALIFSQWVATLRRLKQDLAAFSPLEFHGQITQPARAKVLEEFHTNPRRHVLLLTYGAGGVGLNLQFAQYVFLFDRWWNPAVEDQAINRVYRIGQKESVFITRFITTGTIEERICDVLERKRALMDEIVPGTKPTASLALSSEEIFGLFDIKVRPRRDLAA